MNTKSIYDLPEIKRRLEPIFIENGVKTAILFGSYAQGQATENSTPNSPVGQEAVSTGVLIYKG